MTHFPASLKRHLPGQFAWLRRLLALAAFGSLAFSLLTAPGLQRAEAGAPQRSNQALGTSVVISEFRTRGPLGDNDEFIKIFNSTQVAVDISGWKIWISDNVGVTSVLYTFPASTLIQPGQYRLIINSLGYSGSFLADSDISPNNYSSDITDTGGIAISQPNDLIIDQVGMNLGSAYKEGSVINPLLGNSDQSYSRNYLYGCQDNNNNSTDFVLITPSTPQNSSSSFNVCPLWDRLVLINEVAWGGTQADDTLAQWIELYNPQSTPINLNNWYLRIPNKGNIPLSGSIPPGGYYLIERNQTDTNVVSDLVYAFPFLDVNGDRLYLHSDTNNQVDSANSNGGPWPAGNRFVDYASMERRTNVADGDTAWITYAGSVANPPAPVALDRNLNLINGTPGQPNWSTVNNLVQTPSPIPTATATPSGLRSIIINEVAWMGTLASADDEWIELYNPGSAPIVITGWKLIATASASSSSFTITLAGVIGPQSYFLLERSDDQTISNINADQIYTGALSDSLITTLRLTTATNEEIDIANSNRGNKVWVAGNPSEDKRCSMERRSGINYPDTPAYWITNSGDLKNGLDANGNPICGTPRNINWAVYVTPTALPVGPTHTATRTRTPTPIPPAKVSQIILNEFLVHPRSDWNNDGLVDSGDEFIELMNVGNVSADLQGWRLDDQEGDSPPYTISGVSLAPGARVVFFASQTGLLLSNRSDSVRVFKANGAISDAFTYTTVPVRDQTWCRLPDGGPTWVFGCEPTLQQANKLAETIFRGERDLPAICESPALPAAVFLTECLPSGLEAWSRRLWDGFLPVTKVFFERHGQEYWIE
jgi:hypothetical protein